MPIKKTNSFQGALLSFDFTTKKRSSGGSNHSSNSTMLAKSSKHKSRSNSTKSAACTDVTELSLDEFHDFLVDKLSKVEGVDSKTLEPLHRCLEDDDMSDFFMEMEHCLQSLLNKKDTTTAPLPTQIVAQLHTYMGLLYMEQNNNKSAVDALMRALWFYSRTPAETLAIALGNHRLGMAYARRKEYQQALDLLDRAIEGYVDPNGGVSSTSSQYYVLAKEDRHSIQEAQQLESVISGKNASRYILRQDIIQQQVAAAEAAALAAAENDETNSKSSSGGRVSRKDRRGRSRANAAANRSPNRSVMMTLARQGTAPARVQRSNTVGSAASAVANESRRAFQLRSSMKAPSSGGVVKRQSTAPPTAA